jgi:hypothetical protein
MLCSEAPLPSFSMRSPRLGDEVSAGGNPEVSARRRSRNAAQRRSPGVQFASDSPDLSERGLLAGSRRPTLHRRRMTASFSNTVAAESYTKTDTKRIGQLHSKPQILPPLDAY